MTGDNEEVHESRGAPVCDCYHGSLSIVQRRAGWVWQLAYMYAFTCSSADLCQAFLEGDFSHLLVKLEFLAASFLFPLSTI